MQTRYKLAGRKQRERLGSMSRSAQVTFIADEAPHVQPRIQAMSAINRLSDRTCLLETEVVVSDDSNESVVELPENGRNQVAT
jgi:hypothetical protein